MRGVRRGVIFTAGLAALTAIGVLVHPSPSRVSYNPNRAYETAATRHIAYSLKTGDHWRHPMPLRAVLEETREALHHHRGDGYVIVNNGSSSKPRPLAPTLRRLRSILRAAAPPHVVRVRVHNGNYMLAVKVVDLDPCKYLPTEGTNAVDIIVGCTITRFPRLETAGIYVCKYIAGTYHLSQHALGGNAVDWVGPHDMLAAAAAWQVQMVHQGWLPAAEILWNGHNLLSGSSVSDHYDHIHDSGAPLQGGSGCWRGSPLEGQE